MLLGSTSPALVPTTWGEEMHRSNFVRPGRIRSEDEALKGRRIARDRLCLASVLHITVQGLSPFKQCSPSGVPAASALNIAGVFCRANSRCQKSGVWNRLIRPLGSPFNQKHAHKQLMDKLESGGIILRKKDKKMIKEHICQCRDCNPTEACSALNIYVHERVHKLNEAIKAVQIAVKKAKKIAKKSPKNDPKKKAKLNSEARVLMECYEKNRYLHNLFRRYDRPSLSGCEQEEVAVRYMSLLNDLKNALEEFWHAFQPEGEANASFV